MTARELTIALLAFVAGSGLASYVGGIVRAWRHDHQAETEVLARDEIARAWNCQAVWMAWRREVRGLVHLGLQGGEADRMAALQAILRTDPELGRKALVPAESRDSPGKALPAAPEM